jgi:glycyl-tRNA synthetase beta chain
MGDRLSGVVIVSDFLLELRCEEVPARMQAGARADLEKLFRKALGDAGVLRQAQDERGYDVTVWSTPRRLALIARDLPLATAAVSEELKGPRVGAPPQALEGFLRKTGLSETDLVERDGVLFAVIEKPGRATADLLAEAIPAIIRAFPWPKSQRWGAASISTESLRWVRPLSAIVALLDGEVVPFEIDGIASGRVTRGHRFHSHGEIEITGADDYAAKLRAAHVIVDHEQRQDLIRDGAAAAAHAEGLLLVADEGLVIENAGLTEWPVPLLGRFDEAFLDVPPEVIQLTARTNQKYFVCEDGKGKLANAFVCTANIVALDGGAEIVAGNRKVLAARLSDARFFWEQDRKVSLEAQREKLGRITFHEKLGTVADKVERVAKLAEWLAQEGIVPNCNPSLARQAAELCKADLVTEMVGEFPELQGLMGGYYARAEGLPDAVADAIRDHYKPVGQGDDVPTAPVTVAVSLADKLDTIACFFSINERPTGSKDPFALRRAALGIIRIITTNGLRLPFRGVLIKALMQTWRWSWDQVLLAAERYDQQSLKASPLFQGISRSYGIDLEAIEARALSKVLKERIPEPQLTEALFVIADGFQLEIVPFFGERLAVQQREAGVRHDLIDAVFALGGEDDLVRLLARVHALQAFVGTEDGTNLLAGYKRAANILKKEGFPTTVTPAKAGAQTEQTDAPQSGTSSTALDPGLRRGDELRAIALSYTPEPAEKALIDALGLAGPTAAAAVGEERFADAMAALATLRAPIDAFFDEVTVNDADPAKRAARLALLAQFRDAVHGVADFSKIEG